MPTSKHVAGIAITVLLAAVAAGSPAVTAQNVAARGADRGAATQPRAVTGSASSLAAIAAIPHAGGAWAVGQQCGGSNRCPAGGHALALRLRGSRWSRVSVPSPGGAVLLTGVGASSSSNAWAVGSYDGSQNLNLFLHWNGKRWRQVRGPRTQGALSGVSVTSADDAWAVGRRRRRRWTSRLRCTGMAASGPRRPCRTLAPAGTSCWGSRRCHVPMPGLWGPASVARRLSTRRSSCTER